MSEPRDLFRSERVMSPPFLSPQGDLAVVASAERSTMQHYTLLAFDTRTGERVAELWDGEGTSVEGGPFARGDQNGDAQLAGTTNQSGFERPLIWRRAAGSGAICDSTTWTATWRRLDWSHDTDPCCLLQTSRAQRRLWIYDVAGDALHALDHPPGYYGWGTYFGPDDEIFATWEDAAHPTRVIALDPETGALRRTVLAAGEAGGPAVAHGDLYFDRRSGDPGLAWRSRGRGTIPSSTPTAVRRASRRRSSHPRRKPGWTRFRLVLDQLSRLDDLWPSISATDLGQPRPLGAGGHGRGP